MKINELNIKLKSLNSSINNIFDQSKSELLKHNILINSCKDIPLGISQINPKCLIMQAHQIAFFIDMV